MGFSVREWLQVSSGSTLLVVPQTMHSVFVAVILRKDVDGSNKHSVPEFRSLGEGVMEVHDSKVQRVWLQRTRHCCFSINSMLCTLLSFATTATCLGNDLMQHQVNNHSAFGHLVEVLLIAGAMSYKPRDTFPN